MLPEHLFAFLQQRIRKQWRICFFSALLFGLIAHLYRLTNWLPNWDGLVFRYDASDMAHFGRCFLGLANSLTSYYELPWLNGLLSLVYIALAAVCVCVLFSAERPVTCILIGGMMAVFPTVTSTMTYTYTADGYCLGLLCACLAALLLSRGGKWSVPAILLIIFSYGIYQAYIAVTIVLLLVHLADGLMFQGEQPLHSLKKALRFLVCGILGSAGYWLSLQAILSVTGTELSDYQGIGDAFSFSSSALVTAAKLCVKRFFSFFFDFSEGLNFYSLLNLLLFAFLIFFSLYALFRLRPFSPWYRGALLLVYLTALPFGASVLYFLNSEVDYHNLMTMGYFAFPLMFILLYERMDGLSSRLLYFKNWSVLLLSSAMIFNFIVIANVSYHELQMAYERSYGTAIRIADRIEQTDGASECQTLAVFGALPGSEAYSLNLPPDITGSTSGYIIRADDPIVNQSVLTATLNDYCGTDFRFASSEEKDALVQSGILEQMSPWPGKDSVLVSGNTVIILLGAVEYE